MAGFLCVRECSGVVSVLGDRLVLGRASSMVVDDHGGSAEGAFQRQRDLERERGRGEGVGGGGTLGLTCYSNRPEM